MTWNELTWIDLTCNVICRLTLGHHPVFLEEIVEKEEEKKKKKKTKNKKLQEKEGEEEFQGKKYKEWEKDKYYDDDVIYLQYLKAVTLDILDLNRLDLQCQMSSDTGPPSCIFWKK